MRPQATAVAAALLLAACAGGDDIAATTSYASEAQPLLLCQQGLSDRAFEWDKGLFDFCESVEAEGYELVWDGEYPAFGALDDEGAYWALFDTLDSDDDGDVDGDDRRYAIHLAGFSWGGMNIAYLAARLANDYRVQGARDRVEAMVLFDAYQPLAWSVPIAKNVARAWVYRQTHAAADDCSADITFGLGYNGPPAHVKNPSTLCGEYDLDAFLGEVDHCGMVEAAADAAFVNLVYHGSHGPWHKHVSGCLID
jgi:hypothetical protein